MRRRVTALTVAVDALATYRLTRLIVADKLTETPRAELVAQAYEKQGISVKGMSWQEIAALPHSDADAPKLAALVTCPWCVSVWCAFGVVALRRAVPWCWAPVAEALAFSAAAGILAGHETRVEVVSAPVPR